MSQLKLEVDQANLDLSFFVERLFNGQSASKDAKSFAADLQRLHIECGGGN